MIRLRSKFFASSPRVRVLASLLIMQFAAFWAVWHWYGERLLNSNGENWSLLALAAAIALCIWHARKTHSNRNAGTMPTLQIFLPIVFVLLYAASFAFAPPLVRAVLAMAAMAATLSRMVFDRIWHVGLSVLLFLSLPLAASLNFFAGFPLRVAVGEATAFLLRSNGLAVWREGVCLRFGEQLIAIDAPCAGVRMLWFGLFLTAALVGFRNLSFWRSVLALATSFVVILLGNVARAAALFYTEAEIVKAPPWAHEAIGVFAFLAVALGIVAVVKFLEKEFKWRNLQFS